MATKTQIVNLALLRLGVQQQLEDADTDTTTEALSARLIFDDERDYVLRDFPWPWARKYGALTLVGTDPNSDWGFSYRYPPDCLAVRRIVTSLGRQQTDPPPFAIGRDGAGVTKTITGATAANPVVITAVAHGLSNNDVVFISGVAGMTQLNNRVFTVANKTADTFELSGEDGSSHSAYTSGGTVFRSGRLLFTDEASPSIEYTFRGVEPEEFDSVFVSMLAWRLGAQLAAPLSRMPEQAKHCLEQYAAERQAAMTRAAAEGQHETATGETGARVRQILQLALTRIGVRLDAGVEAVFPRLNFADERDQVLRDFPWPFAGGYAELELVDGESGDPVNDDWTFAYRIPHDSVTIRRIVTGAGRRDTSPEPWQIRGGHERPNATAITMTLATTATPGEIEITASAAFFASTDVGHGIRMRLGPDSVTVTIEAFDGTTVVRGTPDRTVAAGVLDTAFTTWSKVFNGAFLYTDWPGLGAEEGDEVQVEYTRKITDPAQFDALFVSALAWKIGGTLAPLLKDAEVAAEALRMYELEKIRAAARALNEAQAEPDPEAEWIRARTGLTGGHGQDWEPFPSAWDIQ